MSSSNESAFRSSLNNIGWSRRTADPDLSTAQPSFLQRINPFGGQAGYIRLPTSQQDLPTQLPAPSAQQENAAWFALSHWERLIVFGCCVLGAAACFIMAFVLMPVLVLKPRKFVVLWTVGSILFLCSFAALQGPLPYIKHLVSPPRIPFTAAYFGSLGLTLYFSVGLRSSLLTLLAAIVQVAALLSFFVSYVPGGISGLRFGGRMVYNRAVSSLGNGF